MEKLKEKILNEGKVREGNILKVDCFLNHQMDIKFLNEVGEAFRERFNGEKIDKILTIEASGIGIAAIASQYFNYAPVVFAKKTESLNLDKDVYESEVHSFTKKKTYKVRVGKQFLNEGENILIIDDFLKTESLNLDKDVYESEVHSFTKKKTYKVRVGKQFLNEGENILIIDDFLAMGCAAKGMIDIVKQSGANLVGVGIVIEKGFQFLNEGENILIIDDFLAMGCAAKGMIDIVKQSGANLVGVGIVIEKGFQEGRSVLEGMGARVESLAIIDKFEDNKVVFK